MKKIFFKTTIITFIILSTIFTAGIFFVDKQEVEKKIVFKPSKEIGTEIKEFKDKVEKKFFISNDGLKLSYWQIKGDKNKPVVVFCHGNDKNISLEQNQNKIKFLVKNGYNVFSLDYRGYGRSEGSPSEVGVYSDLISFIDYLSHEYNIPKNNIALWGHSLGAAIVIDAAAKIDNLAGVIAEGGFTSVEDMKYYRIENERDADPVTLWVRDTIYKALDISQKFESKNKINNIEEPMLIIHAKADETVPFQMGVKLSELKPDASVFFSDKGHHSDYGWQNQAVLNFLNSIK